MYQTYFFLYFCIFLLFFLYYVICCVFDIFVIQIVILLWVECGLNLPGMGRKREKKKKPLVSNRQFVLALKKMVVCKYNKYIQSTLNIETGFTSSLSLFFNATLSL